MKSTHLLNHFSAKATTLAEVKLSHLPKGYRLRVERMLEGEPHSEASAEHLLARGETLARLALAMGGDWKAWPWDDLLYLENSDRSLMDSLAPADFHRVFTVVAPPREALFLGLMHKHYVQGRRRHWGLRIANEAIDSHEKSFSAFVQWSKKWEFATRSTRKNAWHSFLSLVEENPTTPLEWLTPFLPPLEVYS